MKKQTKKITKRIGKKRKNKAGVAIGVALSLILAGAGTIAIVPDARAWFFNFIHPIEVPIDPILETFIITVDLANGQESTTLEVEENSIYLGPVDEPTREGYTFAGWDSGDYQFGTPVTENVTVTALWEEVTPQIYTVTLVFGDGSENAVYPFPEGHSMEEPFGVTREGYSLVGWQTEPAYTWGAPITQNIVATAQWQLSAIATPTNLVLADGVLSWDAVPHAQNYVLVFDNGTEEGFVYDTADTQFDIANNADGTALASGQLQLIATADGVESEAAAFEFSYALPIELYANEYYQATGMARWSLSNPMPYLVQVYANGQKIVEEEIGNNEYNYASLFMTNNTNELGVFVYSSGEVQKDVYFKTSAPITIPTLTFDLTISEDGRILFAPTQNIWQDWFFSINQGETIVLDQTRLTGSSYNLPILEGDYSIQATAVDYFGRVCGFGRTFSVLPIQTITLAQLAMLENGTLATIEVVVAGFYNPGTIYVQDGTGYAIVYATTDYYNAVTNGEINIGDTIRVTGSKTVYFSNLELQYLTELQKIEAEPQIITSTTISGTEVMSHLCQKVTMTGTFVSTGSTGGININFGGAQILVIMFDRASIPTQLGDLTGKTITVTGFNNGGTRLHVQSWADIIVLD